MNVVKFKHNTDWNDFEKLFGDWKGISDIAFNWNDGKSSFAKSEINEDKDNFYISLEVPGVNKEDVKINLEDNTLTISGSKKKNEEFKDKTVIANERYYGEFKRTFNLTAEIKTDSIEAKYADGVLHIMLPKVEEVKPVVKEIVIK